MKVNRVIPDITVDDIAAAREFYAGFLGLSSEEFNLGWVARFTSPDTGASVQVLTADATGQTNPVASVLVDDVDAAYAEAKEQGIEIVHPLTHEEWGVRRFFVRAPDGSVFNIVAHPE
ncbi:VOC family protein [Brevibacterium spongiae]|uniref:VOC family protein n=1 Tax=Brevibacterium spongiae TaxID=2909672 RepID=A0ABY5SRW9_9MICO|nr:VOC family protein [Brevibacterium spongiae]UVI36875.1 VOC family protein [Brevibacterium spongiae]